MNFDKEFLLSLEERFGQVDEIKKIADDDKPEVIVFYFRNLPEKGSLTAITCGLSNAKHPDWKFGAPELIVTLDTEDTSWGLAAGYFASAFFGEKRFSYGDVFKVDDSLSDESEMNGYFLFAPSFLDHDEAEFKLSERTIHLVGMYPVYNEEIDIYYDVGLERFWKADNFDMYDPKRLRVTEA